MKVAKATIIQQTLVAEDIYELVVHNPFEVVQPGQFLQVQVPNQLLRRPLSIAAVDEGIDTLTIVYRISGAGTKQLSQLKRGDALSLFGPLGNGYPLTGEDVLIVGGGIGIPPLYELSRQLLKRGARVTHVLGYKRRQDVYWVERFQALAPTFVATADGSIGTKGTVVDVLATLDMSKPIYACGAKLMLAAITEAYPHVQGFLSMEERMACGIGDCIACVCRTKENKGYKKVCSDGPVFQIGEVVI